MTITSHTLVKNGMPFVGKVLLQVAPFMDEIIITISEKSDDGTMEDIKKHLKHYWSKVRVFTEDVSKPAELTEVQNMMVNETKTDWILFLSDDDYWPQDALKLCLDELDKDDNILAYSVNPYQLLDFEHHDSLWLKKSFSKFLRTEGLRFIKNWPREMSADKDNKILYWKTNPQVKKLPHKFYHLSYIKDHSFRTEDWSTSFRQNRGDPIKLPKPFKI